MASDSRTQTDRPAIASARSAAEKTSQLPQRAHDSGDCFSLAGRSNGTVANVDGTPSTRPRPRATGKFFRVAGEKLLVRGVTYGTFRPSERGGDIGFPRPEIVQRDLAQMAMNGVNALRVYTIPPRWLLDEAARSGLRVMVGIPWEQHIAFLDESWRVHAIEQRIRAGVEACAGHPAVLCYAVGNEIPPSIVRWVGHRRVERHVHRLYDIAKSVDPEGLVTYGNFPSTEYLHLPFLDVVCFNVYLEQAERLDLYLARLQNLAGDRPLMIGEIGLDSRRNGQHGQARLLYDQLQITFSGGCAGAFVFSWTDEWHRGGQEIRDWDFGLTARNRSPKAALRPQLSGSCPRARRCRKRLRRCRPGRVPNPRLVVRRSIRSSSLI